MEILRKVIGAIAILMLIKGLMLAFFPERFQKLAAWIVSRPVSILKTLSGLWFILGTLLTCFAVAQIRNPIPTAGVIFGLIFVAGGFLYRNPNTMKTWTTIVEPGRSPLTVRILGVLGILISLFVFFVCVFHQVKP